MVAPSVFVQVELWDWLQHSDSLPREDILCLYIAVFTIDIVV